MVFSRRLRELRKWFQSLNQGKKQSREILTHIKFIGSEQSLKAGSFRGTVQIHANKQSFLLSSIRIQYKNEYTACTNGHNGTDPD